MKNTFYETIILSQLILLSMFATGGTNPQGIRKLQTAQTLNYRATYRADFQHLLDPSCNGSLPVIGVFCPGANMTILNTSDSSIGCFKIDSNTVDGSLYRCDTTCSGNECDGVYRASNASSFFDKSFGSVMFMCESEDYRNVSATFIYAEDNATCSSSTIGLQNRNYHVGRLGILCPVGSNRKYVFDDSYFECAGSDPAINTQVDSGDAYTCTSGNDCGGQECDVIINRIGIASDVPTFFDSCVEKTTNVTIATPTVSPATSSFKYTAQFEANWAVLYDSEVAMNSCTNAHGGAIVSCDNGSSIAYLNSTDASMNCTVLNDFELSCIGSEDSINNQFTRVVYECTGPTIPTASVTFLQSDSVCALVQETVTVRHTVALGVVCTIVAIYADAYTECASASHEFYSGYKEFNFPLDFLICSESVSFSLGTSTTPQLIPNVTIRTSDYLSTLPERHCITTTPANESPSSSAPMIVPSTELPPANPSGVLTTSPTMVPSIETGTISPSRMPTLSRGVPSTIATMNMSKGNDSDSGAFIGIVVGSIVAGLCFIALIGYFVWFRNRAGVATSKAFAIVSDTEHHENDDFPPPTPQRQSSSASTPPDARQLTSSGQFLPDLKDQCRSVVMPSTNRTSSHNFQPNEPDARQLTSSGQFLPDLKDQCRSVAMPPTNRTSSHNVQPNENPVPTENDSRIPIARNDSGVRQISHQASNQKNTREPPGRQFLDW